VRKPSRHKHRRGGVSLGRRGKTWIADARSIGGERVALGEFRTFDEARDAFDRWYDARATLLASQADHTIGDLWDVWLDYRARDGHDNTIYGYNWRALAGHFGSRRPANLTDEDWRDYASQRFAAGISPWTVHTELSRLSNCLSWAVKHKKLSAMPIVWLPRRGAHRSRVLTPREVMAIIEGASDHHIKVFVLLAVMTGARHSAILDLTWDRIDWIEGTINFEVEVERDPMSKAWKKGRATVPMGSRLRAELDDAYKIRQCDHVVSHGGRRLKSVRDGFRNAVERAHKAIGGLGEYDGETFSTDITPHVIRHTVNTWLREARIDPEDRALMLGQADVEINKQVYTHASAKVLTGAVGIIDESLAAIPQNGAGDGQKPTLDASKSPVLSNLDKTPKTREKQKPL